MQLERKRHRPIFLYQGYSVDAVRAYRSLPTRNSAIKKNSDELEMIKRHLSVVPVSDPWLNSNSAAKSSVERGLRQAAAGELCDLGSFAEFANLEIDD